MKPDLAALLAHWQRALRLLDWRIKIAYVRGLVSPDGTPCYGLCSRLADNKTAQIQICDPEGNPFDVEQIVIHELLHLHFAPFETSAPAEIAAEEQAVWSIAEALAGAKGTAQEGALVRAALARTSAPSRRMVAPRRQRRAGMNKAQAELLAAAMAAYGAGDKEKGDQIMAQLVASATEEGAEAPVDQAAAVVKAEEGTKTEEKKDEPKPAARGAAQATTSPKIVSEGDVLRLLRQEQERRELLDGNADRPGMSQAFRAALAGLPIVTMRGLIAALPPKPAAPSQEAVQGAAGTRAAASHGTSGPEALTPGSTVDEQFAIKRLGQIMGADPGIVASVRARMAKGEPVGLVTPESIATIRAARTQAAPAAAKVV